MKRLYVIFIIILVVTSVGFAQTLTPTVFASGGVEKRSKGLRFSGVIGQVFVPVLRKKSGKKAQLSHGFQLPSNIITTPIKKDIQIEYDIKVYPNPTIDLVYIKIDNKGVKLNTFVPAISVKYK